MMIKGIAITSILLLTVGIIVSGIVIYQVYRTTTGTQLSEHECRTRMVNWCTGCWNTRWLGTMGMNSELLDCASEYWGISHTDCDAETHCSGFIPTWGGGGGSVTTTTSATTTTAPTTCVDAGGIICTTRNNCENLRFGSCICQDCYDCTGVFDCCCDS